MLYLYPAWVRNFRCRQCGQCCRRDWQVTLGKESWLRYREWFDRAKKQAEFDEAFVRSSAEPGLDEYAHIRKQEGQCWFLEPDARCRLHRLGGHGHLDLVCQTYPRYPMDTARGWEITLSLSCPEVLRLAWTPEPWDFVRDEMPPLAFAPAASVMSVFPRQNTSFQLQYYYFTLEESLRAILQYRGWTLARRLEYFYLQIAKLEELEGLQELSDKLSSLLRKQKRDFYGTAGKEIKMSRAEVLFEHFLVNTLFKKVGYLYGWRRVADLFRRWEGKLPARITATEMAAYVQEWEVLYGHDRQRLWQETADLF